MFSLTTLDARAEIYRGGSIVYQLQLFTAHCNVVTETDALFLRLLDSSEQHHVECDSRFVVLEYQE